MSEPLFVIAKAKLSAAAFKRWLASPAPRPGDGVDFNSGEAHVTVLDSLVAFLGTGDPTAGNQLLCRYDKTLKELQFSAHLPDGSTLDSRAVASSLATLVSSVSTVLRGKEKVDCVIADLGTMQEPELPPWFMAWLEALPELGLASDQVVWIDEAIRRSLHQHDLLLNASPEYPVRVGWIFADGDRVYAQAPRIFDYVDNLEEPGGMTTVEAKPETLYVLEGANPRAIRALDDFFYADGNQLWYCNVFSGNAPRLLAHCKGQLPRLYKVVDFVPDILVTLGDCAWNEAYDDSKPRLDRLHVKATPIDGSTFERIGKDNRFRDQFRTYSFRERLGLCADDDPRE